MAQKPINTVRMPGSKGASKRKGLKPDFATLGGLGLALAGILGGLVLEKGSIQDVAQVTAALIVLGGTMGAVLITSPLPVVVRALKGLRQVFFDQTANISETIEMLIGLATLARRNGIISLESEAAKMTDPFMGKALNLAVDGTDLTELRKMMEIDIEVGEHSEEQVAKIWESAGGYAPTIGIIGAVLGLIQVMKNLDDIREVGHGIAVAFVATLYGVGSANILFLPFANKIRARIQQTRIFREMTLEGVIGIVEGLNPTLIRLKLAPFNLETAPAAPKLLRRVSTDVPSARVTKAAASGD